MEMCSQFLETPQWRDCVSGRSTDKVDNAVLHEFFFFSSVFFMNSHCCVCAGMVDGGRSGL